MVLRQPGLPHRVAEGPPPVLPHRPVLVHRADVAQFFAAFADDQPGDIVKCVVIVVIHAGDTGQTLADEHGRGPPVFQGGGMGVGEHGSDKDHAVHPLFVEGVQIIQFFLRGISGIGQQELESIFLQNGGDTGCDAADGKGVDSGEDNADGSGFSGPQGLGLGQGAVSGFLDHFLNSGSFLFGEVSVIKVSGDSGGGDARPSGNFRNIHE